MAAESHPPRTLSDIVRDVEPSLVCVKTPNSSGSGFVVDYSGNVITNAHVVGQHADVILEFVDGTAASGIVLGVNRDTDLACIRLTDAADIVPLAMGDSDLVQVGEDVLALGYPLNDILKGSPTVTRGIVSARRPGRLQTDPAINPGSSGGPLVDTLGQAIGVNTSVLDSVEGRSIDGIGFAIPINYVKASLRLLASGQVPVGNAANDFETSELVPRSTYVVGNGSFSIKMPRRWTLAELHPDGATFTSSMSNFWVSATMVARTFPFLSLVVDTAEAIKEETDGWQNGVVAWCGMETGEDGDEFYSINYQGDPGHEHGMCMYRRELRQVRLETGSSYILTAELEMPATSSNIQMAMAKTVASLLETVTFRLAPGTR